MTTATGSVVADYMRRLGDELRDLPRGRREELMGEIRDHIEELQDEQDAWDEAGIRNVLEQIGDPADIAEEARAGVPVRPRGMGLQEIAALILLAVGGLIFPVIGWIIGVALLWGSNAWTRRDKLIGTLVVPGGLAVPLYFFVGASYTCFDDGVREVCEGKPSSQFVAVILVGAVAAVFTPIYLAQRARRGAEIRVY